MEIPAGYLSPHFVTDPAREEAKLDEPYFLIVKGRLVSFRRMLGVLDQVARSGRSLLVVAEEIEGEVLATLVVNKVRGSLRCCAIRISATGAMGDGVMRDLASLTGATLLSDTDLDALTLDDLGRADRAVVSADSTTVLGGALLN
jgi:chaperonin GroEL